MSGDFFFFFKLHKIQSNVKKVFVYKIKTWKQKFSSIFVFIYYHISLIYKHHLFSKKFLNV